MMTLENCIIKGADTPLSYWPDTDPNIENLALTVISGNIEGLIDEEGQFTGAGKVGIAEASKQIELSDESLGVTGTVITSPATTALIVQKGNA